MDWWRSVARAVRSTFFRRRRRPRPAGLPQTVEGVIARLQELDRALPPGDGISAFNRMYLRVTELVLERIEEGFFADDAFLRRLDVIFAGLYLEQVDAEPDAISNAWAPLFEQRHSPCEPIQFALAGMNAHINHDLPIAVVDTCAELGLKPSSVQADYDAVTEILASVHEEVRQSFLAGALLDVDRHLSPVLTLLGNWSIARARDAAWVNAGVLWELGGVRALEQEYLATLSSSVGMAGRYLLTPAAELAA